MNNFKAKLSDCLQLVQSKLGERPMLAMLIFFGAVVFSYLVGLIAWVNLSILVCILTGIQFFIELLLNEKLGEKRAGKAAWLMVISIGLSFASLLAWPFISMSKAAGIYGACKIMALALGFIALVGTCVFARSDSGEKTLTWMKGKNIKLSPEQETRKTGDIVLCIDKAATEESHKTVLDIIPYEDRFLHMLVLGPTGCGKTSQILLPMINQDLQNPEFGVTIIEPKGDLAQQAAMIADHYGRPRVYFDPSMPGCPFYNPLVGQEDEVMESMATTFRMLNSGSSTYFLDQDEQLARNAIKVLKRLDAAEGVDGKYATFINMGRLLQNSAGYGRELINKFRSISAPTEEEGKENFDIASWFLNDYFGERSKIYQDTSELRTQVAKINSNSNLRRVLNPDLSKGEQNEIIFDKHLAECGVLCISTAQGALGKLGSFLGYFLILQLQANVFRRPGNEDTRPPHALYIDEFQEYANPGFGGMLTQGRSYRVASVLATQARSQMAMGGGHDGKHFVDLVDANARNVVIFPGVNYDDAKYYSNQFGEIKKLEVMKSVSRKRFNLITGGMDKLGHPSESVREQMKSSALFSPTDIINLPFKEVTYRLVQYKSIQRAKVGKIEFIPTELRADVLKRIEQFDKDHQFAENEPKAATDIVWDDGDEDVEDLGGGLSFGEPAKEDDEPAGQNDFVLFEKPPKKPKVEKPSSGDEEKKQPLDWDLLDTSGDPEDGFIDERVEEDDLLGL